VIDESLGVHRDESDGHGVGASNIAPFSGVRCNWRVVIGTASIVGLSKSCHPGNDRASRGTASDA
jgi:hypothetical protein